MLQASVFTWISAIMTIICIVWCIGLGIFVLVKFIMNKVRAKREQNTLINEHEQERKRKFGYGQGTKKGK